MIVTANNIREDVQWLGFLASPTFALMTLVSMFDAPGASICGADADLSPFNTMTTMYLLMALFHLSPWLKLARRRLINKGE